MARDIVYQCAQLVPVEIEIERYGPQEFTVRKTEYGTQVNHINFYLTRQEESEDEYLQKAIDEGLTVIWG